MYNLSYDDQSNLFKIMICLSIISYFIFPFIGLHLKKNKEGITHGMILGTVISIFCWFKYGLNIIKIN
jgi:Na+/proline symporter